MCVIISNKADFVVARRQGFILRCDQDYQALRFKRNLPAIVAITKTTSDSE